MASYTKSKSSRGGKGKAKHNNPLNMRGGARQPERQMNNNGAANPRPTDNSQFHKNAKRVNELNKFMPMRGGIRL